METLEHMVYTYSAYEELQSEKNKKVSIKRPFALLDPALVKELTMFTSYEIF